MELIFLGTSAAIPTKNRNLSSVAIVIDGEQIIFDVGEDIQRQFEKASLKFNVPTNIFISHLHGDHVIGLPGLLFHFSLNQRDSKMNIFGPKGIYYYLITHKFIVGLKADYLENIYEFQHDSPEILKYNFQDRPDQEPQIINLKDKKNILYEGGSYTIELVPVKHSVPTWGFKLFEKDKPGKFNPERALELGIPRGNLWKQIQYMNPGDILKYQGKSIDPYVEGIIGPKKSGYIISYSGDSAPCENLEYLAKNSDIFICEATYGDEQEDLAKEKLHMTAKQCAIVAKNNSVKLLILTHISSRYSEEEDIKSLLSQAKQVFENTLIASDLFRYELK